MNVKPLSLDEFEALECPGVELTNQYLIWWPHSSVFEDQENAIVDHHGHIVKPRSKQRRPLMTINSVTASTCADDAADLMEGSNCVDQLERNVNASHVCTERIINTHKSFCACCQ